MVGQWDWGSSVLSEREIVFSKVTVERGFAPRLAVQSALQSFVAAQKQDPQHTQRFDSHLVTTRVIDADKRDKIGAIVERRETDLRLARLAVRNGFVKKAAISRALQIQRSLLEKKHVDRALGHILTDERLLTRPQHQALATHMRSNPRNTGEPPNQADESLSQTGVDFALVDSSELKSGAGQEASWQVVADDAPATASYDVIDQADLSVEGDEYEVVESESEVEAQPATTGHAHSPQTPGQPTPETSWAAHKKRQAEEAASQGVAPSPAPAAGFTSWPPTATPVTAAGELEVSLDIPTNLEAGLPAVEERPEDLAASTFDLTRTTELRNAAVSNPEGFSAEVLDPSTDVFPIPDWVLAEAEKAVGLPGGPATPSSDAVSAGDLPMEHFMSETTVLDGHLPLSSPPPARMLPPLTPLPPLPPNISPETAKLLPAAFKRAFDKAFQEAWQRAWSESWNQVVQQLKGEQPPPPAPPPPQSPA